MEENIFDQPIHSNGISLQLRSKEVSEVMGNIPVWISGRGAFLLFFFFIISMVMMFNIQCIDTVNGKASLEDQQVNVHARENYILQVTVPKDGYDKFKTRQTVTLTFPGPNNRLNNLTGVAAPVPAVNLDKESGVLQIAVNKALFEKMIRTNPAFIASIVDCQVISEKSAFEKIFGSLF